MVARRLAGYAAAMEVARRPEGPEVNGDLRKTVSRRSLVPSREHKRKGYALYSIPKRPLDSTLDLQDSVRAVKRGNRRNTGSIHGGRALNRVHFRDRRSNYEVVRQAASPVYFTLRRILEATRENVRHRYNICNVYADMQFILEAYACMLYVASILHVLPED